MFDNRLEHFFTYRTIDGYTRLLADNFNSRPPMEREHTTGLPVTSTFASVSHPGCRCSSGTPEAMTMDQVPVDTTVKGFSPHNNL